MSLRLEYAPDNASKAVLMYGPLVMAEQLGTQGLSTDNNWYLLTYQTDYKTLPAITIPKLRLAGRNVNHFITQTATPLQFVTTADGTDTGSPATFYPYYLTHHVRQNIYLDIIP